MPVLGEETHDVPDGQGHTCLVGGAHHRLGVGERSRQRLLAEHVLPRTCRSDRVLRVQVRRRRDHDEIDVVRGTDLFRARDAGAAFPRECCRLIEGDGGHGDDLRAVDRERAVRVHRTGEPRAEDADP